MPEARRNRPGPSLTRQRAPARIYRGTFIRHRLARSASLRTRTMPRRNITLLALSELHRPASIQNTAHPDHELSKHEEPMSISTEGTRKDDRLVEGGRV